MLPSLYFVAGSIFHLLACLCKFGNLGMNCIGRSEAQAVEVYSATADKLVSRAKALRA